MLFTQKNGLRLFISDRGLIVSENADGSATIVIAGNSHDLSDKFEDVAKEFGYEPPKPKKGEASQAA